MDKSLGKIRYNITHGALGSRGIFILVSFIIIAMIVDTSIVKISAFTGGLASSGGSSIAIFTAMALIFSVGQYLILAYIKRRNHVDSPYGSLRLSRLHKSVSIIQYTLVVIFSALITQMVLTSSYHVLIVGIVIWINYVLAIILLGFLSQRFISWFRSNHNAAVLAYALAMMMISINAVFTLLFLTNQFTHSFSGPIIQPALTPVANYGSVYDIFNAGYVITSIISFILMWIATVLLLHNYSRRFGRAKYWILVSIPLIYFLSQFQFVFVDLFTSFRISQPILFGVVYTLFFDATIPLGGALFGIAFWSVARKIGRNAVRRYMMISAYGMMLLFSSNQATGLALVPYPPFGLATVSFFGLSSFLVFVGIYSSAISVSEDFELRKSIRRYAIEESRLLDSIGMAQMEREIEKRVLTLAKRNQDKMVEETGVQTSLSENDVKQYLEQVLQEVRKQKTRRANGAS
jgi:hypothetical protein